MACAGILDWSPPEMTNNPYTFMDHSKALSMIMDHKLIPTKGVKQPRGPFGFVGASDGHFRRKKIMYTDRTQIPSHLNYSR